jgi:acetyltransferase-like isoleucine patch superfamily enzyme
MLNELYRYIKRNGLSVVYYHFLEMYLGSLIRWLPGFEGFLLRSWLYKTLFLASGKNLYIYPNVYIIFSHKIKTGNRVAINTNTYIDGGGGIDIGNDVMIGPNCVLSSREHSFKRSDSPMIDQPIEVGKITIGDNVWVGANVFMKRNINVGTGSIIAAGSMVTKDVPKGTIFGGVPGKVIRYR